MPGTTDDNLKLMATDGAETCSKDAPCTGTGSLCLRGTCWKDKQAVIEVTSGDPSEFSVEPPEGYNNPPGIVAGQSNDMKIKFAPKTAGAKSAKETIYNTDPTRPALVLEVIGQGADMPPFSHE